MYYSNTNIEEFDRFVESLGSKPCSSIAHADYVFVDLEQYVFANAIGQTHPVNSFADHRLSTQELNNRFNKLLAEFNNYEQQHAGSKQFRLLVINLIDIQSNFDDELFQWSYFNHKFAASQGQDKEAMEAWHKLEQKLSIDKITRFKALRENNLSFIQHVIRNHIFFDEIIITGTNPQIKNEIKFGLDIAEEQYIHKLIKEHQAHAVCRIVDYRMGSLVLNLLKKNLQKRNIKLKANIASTSRNLNPYQLLMVRNIFSYLAINETNIKEADFVFLINDLDLLGVIPIVDTDKPIFTADLSQPSTPNFSYLLLKDEGFGQIYSYAKKRPGEAPVDAFIRSLVAGLMNWILKRKFTEQLAANYMDDYFLPLAQALDKEITEFQGPIDLLSKKLS